MVITDKVVTQNGADFTFVCGKVPFAVSCSTNLPHKDFNMIDLDLINKMKIPLKNIRVTRITVQGNDLRCVGVISQTIQCVVGGKISGTIHLYAKVVRDLYNSMSTDCLASRKTFFRLMGEDPMNEPPDDPSIEVLGGDDDEESDIAASEDDEENDIAASENVEENDIAASKDVEENDIASSNEVKEQEDVVTVLTPDNYDIRYSTTPYDEKTLYPEDSHQVCYDSDGNYDPVLTDFVNNDYPPDVYYQGGQLHKMRRRGANTKTSSKSHSVEKHCQYCFLNGESIKVAHSHNIMDIDCPSMTDDERRRIHGDKETDRWLARMYGYED